MSVRSKKEIPKDVALVGFDVDGVFTDGRFYLSDAGIESKAFNTQDGYGVRQLLIAGIAVAVISGRVSGAVEQRMAELGVQHIAQGCPDKVAAFEAIADDLGVDRSQTVFVGDDVPDLPLLKHAGFSIAVANAVDLVKAEADLISTACGGHGAVREICDLVLRARERQ